MLHRMQGLASFEAIGNPWFTGYGGNRKPGLLALGLVQVPLTKRD